MNPEEYTRMHALETDYWWFVGRRTIIAGLLGDVKTRLQKSRGAKDCGLRLLDIGCGTGASLPMLQQVAGKTGSVTGVDFSPLALQFARDGLENFKPQTSDFKPLLLRGDALQVPFRDATFDVVTMFDVLEHLSDDAAALREVRRVLRPGGAFVWSVPAYKSLWSAHDEALHHFRRYEFRELQSVLRRGSFRVWRLSFAMSLLPPATWLFRRLILPLRLLKRKNVELPDDRRTAPPDGAVLPSLPPILNRAMIAYVAAEAQLIRRRPLRFGTSLVGIALKE